MIKAVMITKFDMTGAKCNSLTVLSPCGMYKGRDTVWLCKCDCGNVAEVSGSYLRSGHTKTCGHCAARYEAVDDYMKCTVKSGRSFIFDTDDFSIVSRYNWSVTKEGYALANNKDHGSIKLHRLLMGFPNGVVDHINGHPDDNRRSNLRITTQHCNTQNSAKPRSNTTGYKGVCFDKHKGKFMAFIQPNGRFKFLGYFSNPVDAAHAYDRAAVFYFGEYARLNFQT